MLRRASTRDDERMRRMNDGDVVLKLHCERLMRFPGSALRTDVGASGKDRRAATSASASSNPRAYRAAGCFARHFITIADNSGGTRALTTSGATGGSCTCL